MENSNKNTYYQGYSLLPAERRALSWMVDVVEVDGKWLTRLPTGPDFVFAGDVAIEVKSRENWSLTKSQVESIGEYRYFIVVVSTTSSIYVDKVYGSISEIEDGEMIDEIIKRMKN